MKLTNEDKERVYRAIHTELESMEDGIKDARQDNNQDLIDYWDQEFKAYESIMDRMENDSN